MRRMLRILGWMGLGLSTVLLVGTVVVWVRSVGHWERWRVDRVETESNWSAEDEPVPDVWHGWFIAAGHGRLWFSWETTVPAGMHLTDRSYQRKAESSAQDRQLFALSFKRGERPWKGGTEVAWHFSGLGFYRGHSDVHPQLGRPWAEEFTLAIPFWMLTVIFGLWPVFFAAWRVFRRRRYGAGLCQECGYDLRATPERCPECGGAVEPKPAP